MRQGATVMVNGILARLNRSLVTMTKLPWCVHAPPGPSERLLLMALTTGGTQGLCGGDQRPVRVGGADARYGGRDMWPVHACSLTHSTHPAVLAEYILPIAHLVRVAHWRRVPCH